MLEPVGWPRVLQSGCLSSLALFDLQESESENKLDGETASDSESKSDFGSSPVPTSDDTPEVLNRALSNLSSR